MLDDVVGAVVTLEDGDGAPVVGGAAVPAVDDEPGATEGVLCVGAVSDTPPEHAAERTSNAVMIVVLGMAATLRPGGDKSTINHRYIAMMRWLKRILLAVGLVAALVALTAVWMVRRPFPTVDGTITIAGLDDLVTVTRDSLGIPVIEATNSHDLFVAQGYVHAQDRFWQMDTWRHIGAGRLAEMFGEGQVDTDSFLRTLGFARLARTEYDTAPPAVKQALDAYAAGVNAYLDEGGRSGDLALEYRVLGLQNSSYSPEDWSAVDSLTWAHVMAWDLRSNLDEEIDRAVMSDLVGVERTEQLYPPFPADHDPIVASGESGAASTGMSATTTASVTDLLGELRTRLGGMEAALGRPFEGIGSNNWVVDGTRTESGLPILANDPHLGIQMPSIWYENSLWCTEVTDRCPYRVTGFSFPGAPGVVIGHNERIAWGVTNEGPDTMDLYVEKTDGANRYEVDGEWVDFDVRSETIVVAGGDEVTIEVRSTRHGPVISGRFGALDDLDAGALELGEEQPRPDELAVALRWRALEPSTLFQALLEINVAQNWDEFRRAASLFDIAPQNLVYADVDGHIGYQSTGEIPIRANGDGRYPVAGWTSDHEWVGNIAFEDLPTVFDPAEGLIVTANQPVTGRGGDRFLGADFAYGYRSQRIKDLLTQGDSLRPEDMMEIQTDDYDGSASFVVPAITGLEAGTPEVDKITELLTAWSTGPVKHQMAADSPGAAAYAAVWRNLLALTFDDELPEGTRASGGSRYFEVIRHLLDTPEDTWWDDVTTDEVETAPDILHRAVAAAHEELVDLLGSQPSSWRWGDLHRATFENQTLGQSGIGLIDAIFNREAEPTVSGGSSIVNASSWFAPEGYDVVAVPSMRMVIDLADFGSSLAVNTTGQSGHAFHRHYFDMNSSWAHGDSHPMRFGPDTITDPEGVLELVP